MEDAGAAARIWSNDPTIADAERLWRRILLKPNWITEDGRVSSMAFKDRNSGLVSVHRQVLTTIEKIRASYPAEAVAAITAGKARESLHGVAPDPEPADPSHAVLIPPSSVSALSRGAKMMAVAAEWVVTPEEAKT